MSQNCAGILRINKAWLSVHSHSYTAKVATRLMCERPSKMQQFMHDTTLGIDVAVGTDVIVWIAFLAGLLSFFSPCVLPLIPLYLTYISGLSFAQLKQADAGSQARRAVVFHSLVFISGFSVVFIALGGLAGFCTNFSRQL
ncbi:MAG: cytochrome c biogenesis protein CcdA [Desulfuromusa sp.]|nr:cytochrome c biogenesis protein CcdA [Desulfuromusa sp.]